MTPKSNWTVAGGDPFKAAAELAHRGVALRPLGADRLEAVITARRDGAGDIREAAGEQLLSGFLARVRQRGERRGGPQAIADLEAKWRTARETQAELEKRAAAIRDRQAGCLDAAELLRGDDQLADAERVCVRQRKLGDDLDARLQAARKADAEHLDALRREFLNSPEVGEAARAALAQREAALQRLIRAVSPILSEIACYETAAALSADPQFLARRIGEALGVVQPATPATTAAAVETDDEGDDEAA